MPTERYKAIMALMDDPLNQACILREYQRRDMALLQLLPPPIPKDGGWVFQNMKSASQRIRPKNLDSSTSWQTSDAVFEVYSDGRGWFVMNVPEDEEVGPFNDSEQALAEAKKLAIMEGYTLLDKMPWSNEDLIEWPIMS